MVFSRLYKIIFKEKINDITAELHNNDPEWFDNHYDELKIWCKKFNRGIDDEYFYIIIQSILLKEPSIPMLDILLKHNFDFSRSKLCNITFIKLKEKNARISNHIMKLDIFKWVIDNKIINENDRNNLCNTLLREADQLSFDKFKYAFEAGFPCTTEYGILISDINIAEQIYQYANNARNINFRYTIGFTIIDKPLSFLKDYIEWIKKYGIEDKILNVLYLEIGKFFGIPGLELLKSNGYIKPKYLEFKGIDNNIKSWLISNGFREIIHENIHVIYHTPEMTITISDNISVITENII